MTMTQNGSLKRDDNDYPVMGGTSSVDGTTIVNAAVDPVTRRLLVDNSGGGSGTVTSVSVVAANGFSGSVANATTTPAITLSTTITGILQGNGTAISAITVGTGLNFSGGTLSASAAGLTVGTSPIASGTSTRILYDNAGVLGEYTISGSGTVVAMRTSPQLVTPDIGVATGTSLDVSGVLESGTNGGTGGQLKMFGATSGDVTLKVAAAAGTATVFQLPASNGTNGYVLSTNGSGVTSWVASGSGTPGTPTNSIQYNNAGSFAGSSTLLFDGISTITLGAENTNFELLGVTASSSNTDGGSIAVLTGSGLGTGTGGAASLSSGSGGATGNGGTAGVYAGDGGATSGTGGNAWLVAGEGGGSGGNGGFAIVQGGAANGGNGNGGDIELGPGLENGSGTRGVVKIANPSNGIYARLDTASINTSDKTFTFPNTSGTFALTTGGALALAVGTTTLTGGTNTRILYDNAGVLGEYTISGTGTVVVMQASPTITGTLTTDTIQTSGSSGVVLKNSGGTTVATIGPANGTGVTFAGTVNFTGAAQSSTNDGSALGASGTAWSDLFLASGGVINWAAGNATLTHSTGLLTSNVPLSLGTTNSLTAGTIELGAASDTTLSRSSAGVLAVEGVVIPSISSTNTLTNKRITRRLTTTNAPGATPTTNTDNVDVMNFTGLNTAITSMTTNLSGTPNDGDLVEFRFLDDGTARAITWGTSFASTTVTMPTTTVISTCLRVLFEWRAASSKWECVATA